MLAAAGGREQGWRSRSTGRQGTQGGSEVGTTSRLRRTPRGRTVAASPSAHGKASVAMFMDLGSAHRPNWREETALKFEPFVERQVGYKKDGLAQNRRSRTSSYLFPQDHVYSPS